MQRRLEQQRQRRDELRIRAEARLVEQKILAQRKKRKEAEKQQETQESHQNSVPKRRKTDHEIIVISSDDGVAAYSPASPVKCAQGPGRTVNGVDLCECGKPDHGI